MKRFCSFVVTLAVLSMLPLSAVRAQQQPSPSDERTRATLDVTPIRDLLHLVGTILDENPNHQTMVAGLAGLEARAQEDSLSAWSMRNASNPRISLETEALLASPAYQLCFRQFRATNPDWFRKFFFALPYRAVDGPSSVGENLLELCRHHREVAAWYDSVIARVDLERCLAVAKPWLPSGEYDAPRTFIIYGNGGDAFVRDGEVCFDLYGVVLTRRPPTMRFENLSGAGVAEIERILAHEFHHVYAYPLMGTSDRADTSWQGRWKGTIIRRIVSEGVAMQCNPPEGLTRAIKEDSAVVRNWIGTLNRLFAGIEDGRVAETQVASWWQDVDDGGARMALADYWTRRYPGGNVDSLVTEHMIDRPIFAYTLGWWMVTHILENGTKHDRVIHLLSQPDSLFSWYNASVGLGDPSLLITASAR